MDQLMRRIYAPNTQKMNPVGIAFAVAIVYLIQKFAHGSYHWHLEARIGTDVFPSLANFRRKSVDIVAFRENDLYAVISSKWGIRHDRIRDPQEEADTYKVQVPAVKFYLVTNEFDNARLQKVLNYPTIDGVFHVKRDLVWQVYGQSAESLRGLRDLTELFPLFP
ncbi:MAG TPA: hypothetical protein VFD70_12735 [Anaerolineae bacterium]|nr:hypothetical protein [Anaerolineae bacterium]